MKIVLFTNKDIESNLAYNLLKTEFSKHQLKIYYTEGVGNPDKKPKELNQLEYFEKEYPFKKLDPWLQEQNIKTSFDFYNSNFTKASFERCKSIKDPILLSELRAFEPDLFISIRFGKIFKGEILGIPKKGILNLHSAILPDYRGIQGTLHALKDLQKEIGCTLHYIPDSKIDTGEIIDIGKMDVDSSRSLFWHTVQLYPLGCKMIVENMRKLETESKLPCEIQSMENGNYYSVPTSDDFQDLKRSGFDAINMQDYAEILHEWICPEISLNILLDKLCPST